MEDGHVHEGQTGEGINAPPGSPGESQAASGSGEMVGLRVPGHVAIFTVRTRIRGVRPGDDLLLETRRGEQMGRVVHVGEGDGSRVLMPGPVNRVVRRITDADREAFLRRDVLEREAMSYCRQKVSEFGLTMKLSRVNYRLDGSKAVFFFTSENRVDFRELVRELSRHLQLRVEMRQVGVRDEARILGGLGPCGMGLCCSQYLREFKPVSVRMAKNQDLSLNPDSISGLCGRLLCCLAYENDVYKEGRAALPKPGSCFRCQDGRAVMVKDVSVIRGKVRCRTGEGTELLEFSPEELFPMEGAEAPVAKPVAAPLAKPVASPLAKPVVAPEAKTVARDGGAGAAPGGEGGRTRSRRRRSGRGSGPRQEGNTQQGGAAVPGTAARAAPVAAEGVKAVPAQGAAPQSVPAQEATVTVAPGEGIPREGAVAEGEGAAVRRRRRRRGGRRRGHGGEGGQGGTPPADS